jgi:hypothetical protein
VQGSVLNYISGVRTWLDSLGANTAQFRSYCLDLIKRGLPSAMSHTPKRFLPVTPDRVRSSSRVLNDMGPHAPVIVSTLLILYFTLIRQSNILPSSPNAHEHALRLSDVADQQSSLKISLRTSKTIRAPRGQIIISLLLLTNLLFCSTHQAKLLSSTLGTLLPWRP